MFLPYVGYLGYNRYIDYDGNITLTRKTVVKILQGIEKFKFAMFKNNPEEFINKVVRYINEQKASLVIDEIKYDITDEEPYTSDIFNLGGVVNFEKAVKVDKHITPYVVVDSDIEKNFALDLDRDEGKVCVYAKLPKTFRIPTPVGNYSPDWAIAFYENSVKYIYFIAETKGGEQHISISYPKSFRTDRCSALRSAERSSKTYRFL